MEKSKIFQISVLVAFAALLIVGFLGFSGKIPFPGGKDEVNYGEVTLWGTIPSSIMQRTISDKLGNNKSITIKYVEKNRATFARDFIEALASGTGPDLFMLSQDEILRSLDKVALIPYTTVPERVFKDTFIEEGEMFLRTEGIVAIPFTIDPMIMYWNRDIFTNASIVAPPTKWSEFYGLAPKVIVRDRGGDITQSLVSFGEYQNVLHAKDILSTLIMQTGASIVQNKNGILTTDLGAQGGVALAVGFFTEFSRPDKDSYSWNRSLPYSRSMFDAGDLALYFGYASEYGSIKQKNPHLNFDIATMPQADKSLKRVTFGRMQGIALAKSSKNMFGAMQAALLLSSSDIVGSVAQMSGLPPVRRNLLAARPTDAVFSILYDSAIISRAWQDPSPTDTDELFEEMINDINSGSLKISQAISILQSSLGGLLVPYRQQRL